MAFQVGNVSATAIKQVYRLGELPDNYADENPIYPKRALRPDGTCDQTNRSWDGVPNNVRQFIRVAIDCGELVVDRVEMAHDILDMAVSDTAMYKLSQRYCRAAIAFDKLLKTGGLPTLKIALPSKISKGNFLNEGKKVHWGDQR